MSVLKIALLGPPEVEHGDHQYHLVPWAWFLSWWFSPDATDGRVCCLRSNHWLNHRNQFYRDVYTGLLWEVNGVHHTQDDLASCMPLRPLLVGLACLGKGQHGVDDGPHLPLIDQCANPDQLLPVGLHHKPDRAHVIRLCLCKGGAGADNGDQHPSWFDHLPGTMQGVTTNCIEDEIDALNHFFKARGGVVDDLVGSQFAQEVAIALRGSRDDLRAGPASKLDGKDPHAACCPVDQDGLPRREARMHK